MDFILLEENVSLIHQIYLKMKSKDLEKIRGRKDSNDSTKCRPSIDTKLKDRLSN